MTQTTTLVFDGYCGFCTRSVGWLERLDRLGRVRIVPFQAPGVLSAHGLTAAQCEAAVWAIDVDGRRHRGAGAVNAAAGVALGSWLPLRVYELPGIRTVQDRVYAWVAANRRRFPGATPYCVAHPEAACGDDGPAGPAHSG